MTDEIFERAAQTYGDTIFRVAYHAVRSRPDAEDVTQTVLLKLYEHKEPFLGEDHLKFWLLRVTVNESRRLLRTPWRRKVVPLEEWDGSTESKEEGEVLEAVMALEPKYRLSIYLYYYEGCSVREVAQALRAKESTVQTWLQRAREKLRVSLTDQKEGAGYVQPEFLP